MTFNPLRLRALLLRAPAEPARVVQDGSLASVLWLLMFLVFAPMVGVHVAFMFVPEPVEAGTLPIKGGPHGKNG